MPECDDIRFEPLSLTKTWRGDWSRYDFEFRPDESLTNETIFLRISVQIEGIEVAHVKGAIDIVESKREMTSSPVASDERSDNPLVQRKLQSKTTTAYQKIFISYSRRDSIITKSYKLAQLALGNDVFIDVDNLRTGEDWQAGLAKAIDDADIFQLFWSSYSAESKYCCYEWEYAMEQKCPDNRCATFIRPVYWQKPMPKVPDPLRHLNFKFVPFEESEDSK